MMISKTAGAPRLVRAAWAGFLGGNLSSFVKWGTEIPLPPRQAVRVPPPAAMIKDAGIDAQALTYTYSGHVLNYGVASVHQLFSIVFGVLYCCLAEFLPIVTLGQGLAFGLLVTLAFHAVLLPLGGWAPPLWQLPLEEVFSELFGHLLWAWTIEIVRRLIMDRTHRNIVALPSPAH